jgi:hypothetical protein
MLYYSLPKVYYSSSSLYRVVFKKSSRLVSLTSVRFADANAFSQEWQVVLDTNPTLFQTFIFLTSILRCTLSTPQATSMLRRRLSDSSVDELAAEKACAHWG